MCLQKPDILPRASGLLQPRHLEAHSLIKITFTGLFNAASRARRAQPRARRSQPHQSRWRGSPPAAQAAFFKNFFLISICMSAQAAVTDHNSRNIYTYLYYRISTVLKRAHTSVGFLRVSATFCLNVTRLSPRTPLTLAWSTQLGRFRQLTAGCKQLT
jgi:hypothetical protein